MSSSDRSSSSFTQRLVSGTSSLLVFFLAPQFSGIEAAKVIIPFVALLVIFDGVRDLTIAFMRAKNKMEIEALITVITNISITVFGFIILYFSATAKAFTLSYVASAGIGTLAAIFILKKEFSGYLPEGALCDDKFDNMSAEEIYNLLPEIPNQKGGGSNQKGEITIDIDKDGHQDLAITHHTTKQKRHNCDVLFCWCAQQDSNLQPMA
ncbi:oligosaccharide flippase family protein [Patescibacteria group bacterium]|nr:oligosaccharide flippase family protein [Patescibacteria group bacterium]